MSTEDLFSNGNQTGQEKTPTPLFENEGSGEPIIDESRDWVSEYVGEGKKFKDVADLAKGKAHSDAFITRLQKEMEGLRNELNTRLKLEEFMDRMNSQNSSGASHSTQTDGQGSQLDGTASNAASVPDIEKLIEERLAMKEAELKEKQNIETARNRLQEAFGENYSQELEARTQQLGLTKEFVSGLARTQPKALFALLGLEGTQPKKQEENIFAPRGSVNTSGLSSGNTAEKNWAYYEKMRKQNPGVYWSTQVQNEIHRQASKLGERFYS